MMKQHETRTEIAGDLLEESFHKELRKAKKGAEASEGHLIAPMTPTGS